MQTKKAKYHLKRIETILSLHEDSLSRLDRDILLEDIRQLYDLVLNHEDTMPSKAPETPRDHTYVKPEPDIEEPTNQDPSPIAQDPESQEPTPQVNTPEPDNPSPSSEPDKVDDDEKPKETGQDTTEPEQPPATVTYEEKSEAPHPSFNETTEHPASSSSEKMNGSSATSTSNQSEPEEYENVLVQENGKYSDLFDFPTTSDLSDQLANTKIDHLNKILTINDKILYINHLFNGEAIPFQESLKKFEGFYTYEEAKKYASEELVELYNWTADEKKETIKQFMRQVKRLYV